MKLIDDETCNIIISNRLKHSRFQLIHFEEKREIEKKGMLSDYGRLYVTIRCDSEPEDISFFIKYFPEESSNKVMQHFVTFNECFKKELLTYQYFEEVEKFLDTADLCPMPRCYYCEYDKFLILEDLAATGFVNVGFENVDILHCKLVLQKLAKFQAANIVYESSNESSQSNSTCRLSKNLDLAKSTMYDYNTTAPFYAFLNSSKKCLINLKRFIDDGKGDTPEFEAMLEDNFEKIFRTHPTYRNVLSHGDLWINNALFRYEEGKPVDCKLIDFQTTSYKLPTFDVLYFIFLTIQNKSRKLHYHELLTFFYDSLKVELNLFSIDINLVLPLSEFRTTCRMLLPQIKVLTILHCTLNLYGDEVRVCSENLEEYNRFLFEDRSPLALEVIKRDDIYKAYIIENLRILEDAFKNTIVTIEDCYQIVENKLRTNDYEICQYELQSFAVGNDSRINYYELNIQIEHMGRTQDFTLFVKYLANTIDQLQISDEVRNLFSKEIRFFTKYIPFLKNHKVTILDDIVPECLMAYEDSLIVFENLREKRYKTLSNGEHLDMDVIKLALTSLAKLHSSCIIIENMMTKEMGVEYRIPKDFDTDFEDLYRTSSTEHIDFLAYKQEIHAIIDLVYNINSKSDKDSFKEFALLAIDSQKDYMVPSTKYRNTICYSNFTKNNFMIQSEDGETSRCVFTDFKSYRYCPPAQDIMSFIYSNTSKLFRNEHIHDLKEYYYNQMEIKLENHAIRIEDIINRTEFMECCNHYEQFAIVETLIQFQICTLTPHIMNNLSNSEIEQDGLSFNRNDIISEIWSRNAKFRNTQTDLIIDLRNIHDERCINRQH